MNKTAVAQQVTDFLKSVTADESLAPTTSLIEAGVVDSLTMMDLVSFIEGEFHFRLGVEDFTPVNFASAETVAELIERSVATNAAHNAA